MKKYLLLFGIACLATFTHAQETAKKVLFIGNSYTYVNDLPSMIKQMGESTGDLLDYQQVTSGGASFNSHCNTTGAMEMIGQGGWDAVVLQGQSQEPSFPWGQFMEQTYPYACQLADAIYEKNDCAEVVFYMTWGRKNGDSYNAQFFDSLATYEGMDDLLCARYTYMAQQNKASVSPVGKVWRKLRADYPDIELYQSDESHPSVYGSYAAACTFYTLFFLKDPSLIATNLSIDAATAQIIRDVAKTVVYDSLYLYSCHSFISAKPVTDSLHWQFECLSSTTPETCTWDFGDGETSTETNPSHTFEPGTYTVTLVAGKACDPDTLSIEIVAVNDTVSPENPDPQNYIDESFELQNSKFKFFPNPANTHFTVRTDKAGTLTIIDSRGRMVKQVAVFDFKTVDIEDLPAGVYHIRIDNRIAGKLIKTK